MKYMNIDGEGGLADYASSGGLSAQLKLGRLLSDISSNLCYSNQNNEGYIDNVIIPNIKEAVSDIKAVNPDARIIIQSVYHPIQFSTEYTNENFPGDRYMLVGMIRLRFKEILEDFRTELNNISGIEVADILNEFTSLPEDADNTEQGNAYYFTDIQLSGEDRDFHPNQRGHLAIAAEILDTIGILHDDDGLMTEVYCSLKGEGRTVAYPHIALDTYKKVAGNFILGDVDFNMIVNGSDATAVLRDYTLISSDYPTMFSDLQNQMADMNKDGIINGSDATMLLRYYTYLSSGGTLSAEDYFKV